MLLIASGPKVDPLVEVHCQIGGFEFVLTLSQGISAKLIEGVDQALAQMRNFALPSLRILDGKRSRHQFALLCMLRLIYDIDEM